MGLADVLKAAQAQAGAGGGLVLPEGQGPPVPQLVQRRCVLGFSAQTAVLAAEAATDFLGSEDDSPEEGKLLMRDFVELQHVPTDDDRSGWLLSYVELRQPS